MISSSKLPLSLVLLFGVLSPTYALPYRASLPRILARQSGAGTNDVICSQPKWTGDGQFPPPVKITDADGSSYCGCASDINTGGGNSSSYEECNTVYPSFGQDGYSDGGLRQNRCYLDDGQNAQCGTTCTPNTTPKGDGSCAPTNPESFSLQSPTTQFGSTTAVVVAGTTTTSTSSSYTWTPTSSNTYVAAGANTSPAQSSPASSSWTEWSASSSNMAEVVPSSDSSLSSAAAVDAPASPSSSSASVVAVETAASSMAGGSSAAIASSNSSLPAVPQSTSTSVIVVQASASAQAAAAAATSSVSSSAFRPLLLSSASLSAGLMILILLQ